MSDKSRNAETGNNPSEHILAGFGKQMVEASLSGMILVDARADDMPVVYVNAAFETLTGYSCDEAIGRNCRFLQGDDRDQPDLDIVRDAIKNKQACTVTLRNYRKDGTLFWNELRVSPISDADGQVTHFVGVQNDVTERKEILEQLRTTSANLRATLNGSNQSFILIDRNARVIDFDRDGAKIAGDIFEKQMRKGDDIYDYVLTRDLASFTTNYNRALAGEIFTVEKEFNGKNATYYFEVDYYPITDTQGDILGVCMSTENITRRRLAEIALAESEARYRLMANNVTDMISTHDIDGVYTFVSPSCEDLLGYIPEELIDRSAYELFHPDDLNSVLTSHQTILQEQRSHYAVEYRIRRKAGDYIWLETISQIVTDKTTGKPQMIIAVSRDITERKASEKHLTESEARFRQLAENIEAIFWMIDLESRSFLYISPAYDDIWQRSHLEVMDDPESFFDTFHPEDRDWLIEEIRRVSENPQGAAYEHRIVRPSGEIRSIHMKCFPILNDSGDAYRMVGISQDITERKKAEQREFELALERERRRLLTGFIVSAAHEFRTPLAAINSSAYLMSRSDDADRRKQKAKQIEGHIQHITRLVDNLLLMTRLDSDNALASDPVDIKPILRTICELVAEKYPESHDLNVEIPSDLPSVMGDADYLSDAFQQIIDNACRFTPEGGKIDIKAATGDDFIEIEIRDSGPGISDNDLPHIFETFWRQDSSHSTPGFGLGLPIARKIIERHGGDITVVSNPGAGTRVTVTLPLVTDIEVTSA